MLLVIENFFYRWYWGSCENYRNTLLLHAWKKKMKKNWCCTPICNLDIQLTDCYSKQYSQEYKRYIVGLTSALATSRLLSCLSLPLWLWASSLSVHSGPWFKISQLRHAVNAKRGVLLLQNGWNLVGNVLNAAVYTWVCDVCVCEQQYASLWNVYHNQLYHTLLCS